MIRSAGMFEGSEAWCRRLLATMVAGMALSAAGLMACAGPGQEAPARSGGVIWTLRDAGLSTPESVLYDADADRYLVSNINGSPAAADGNGFISRILPDGQVDQLKWIEGGAAGVSLDAPKGMALVANRLYVSDVHVVRVFDRRTGKALETIPIEGSGFLNDLTPAPGGGVYVSDSATNTIFHIGPGGIVSTAVSSPELAQPNGLLSDERGLIAVSFGGKEAFALSAEGKLERFAELPAGGLDGLVRAKDGRYIVSSWEGEALYAIAGDGIVTTLADRLRAPADIGYDGRRDRLLVPLFKDDEIVVLSAAPARP